MSLTRSSTLPSFNTLILFFLLALDNQDYEDSITFPKEGANRGSCVFAQTAVMGKRSSRDTRQQSRLVRGNAKGFTISTIDHLKGTNTHTISYSYQKLTHRK